MATLTDDKTIQPARRATLGTLLKVGPTSLVRAASELSSFDTGYDITSDGARLKSVLPGATELALSRVDAKELEAKNILESLLSSPDTGVEEFSVTESWGHINSDVQPFDGPLVPGGMLVLATTLTLAVGASLVGLSFLAGLATGRQVERFGPNGRGFKGKSYKFSDGNGGLFSTDSIKSYITEALGIRPTTQDYFDCVKAGFATVVGSDISNGGLLQQLTQSFKKLAESPGYYVVLFRTVARDARRLADLTKSLGSSFKTSPLAVVDGVTDVIRFIRGSKIIAFMNVFAVIGDLALQAKDQKDRNGGTDNEEYPTYAPKSEFIRGYAGNSGKKLAWANDRALSHLLLPERILASHQAFARDRSYMAATSLKIQRMFDPAIDHNSTTITDQDPSNRGRIDDDLRIQIEKRLDSQYVPFYFHDVRTNEIISFHAFLTSLTDDYSPNWDGTDAYGRIDQIKIYKSTGRKISLSFYVVATNEEDMDEMYMKINKLVTLVYPQWSRGDVFATSDGKNVFTQPFTQTPTASPLIRLRLGDLIQSNYSKFALARLFGAGEVGTLRVDDEPFYEGEAKKVSDDIKKNAVLPEQRAVQSANGSDKIIFQVRPSCGGMPIETMKSGGIPVKIPIPIPTSGGGLDTVSFASHELEAMKVRILKVSPDSAVEIQFAIRDSYSGLIPSLEEKIAAMASKTYTVPIEYLQEISASDGAVNAPASPYDTRVLEFFSEEQNTIVRSFKSSGGRGIACTIDSLNLDWWDGNKIGWETYSIGKCAPRMCLVKVSVTPIHDIAPGIDHKGFNRAPVYPVGYFGHDNIKAGTLCHSAGMQDQRDSARARILERQQFKLQSAEQLSREQSITDNSSLERETDLIRCRISFMGQVTFGG